MFHPPINLLFLLLVLPTRFFYIQPLIFLTPLIPLLKDYFVTHCSRVEMKYLLDTVFI